MTIPAGSGIRLPIVQPDTGKIDPDLVPPPPADELAAAVLASGAAVIDDTTSSASKTWSSQKSAALLGTKASGVVGPSAPSGLTVGTEYVWFKTDGAGTLLDILSGVA